MDLTPYEDMMSWLKKHNLHSIEDVVADVELRNKIIKHAERFVKDTDVFIRQFLTGIRWIFKFKQNGEKVFNVSADLVKAFSETSCESYVELIQVPFNAFMIEIPKGTMENIQYIEVMKKDQDLTVIYKEHTGGSLFPGLELRNSGVQLIEIPESGIWKEPKESLSIVTMKNETEPGCIVSGILIELHRFVVNFLLYLNSTAPDLEEKESERSLLEDELRLCKNKEKNKKRKLKNKINPDSSRLGFILVGRNYKPKGGQSTGRHLEKRFRVRGHWRKQPYGPKNDKKYKALWIEPYWKGPDKAEVLNRRYKLEA